MTYGASFNLFLKNDTTKENKEKLEILKQYSTADLLTLLRNMEELPYDYDVEIIKGVYDCLFDKGIMCI